VRLTRIILPAQVFLMLGAISRDAARRATVRRRRFAPSAYTVGIIVVGWLFPPIGAEGFAWGVLAARRWARFGIRSSVSSRRHDVAPRSTSEPTSASIGLALPVMIGQSIVGSTRALDGKETYLPEGSVSTMQYAKTLLTCRRLSGGGPAAAAPDVVDSFQRRSRSRVRALTRARRRRSSSRLSQALLSVLGGTRSRRLGFRDKRFRRRGRLAIAQCLCLFALSSARGR